MRYDKQVLSLTPLLDLSTESVLTASNAHTHKFDKRRIFLKENLVSHHNVLPCFNVLIVVNNSQYFCFSIKDLHINCFLPVCKCDPVFNCSTDSGVNLSCHP